MADPDVDKLTNDAVHKGGILSILYFDMHSKNPEALSHLATGFVDSVIKTQGVIYAIGEIDEPMENNGAFSTTVEIKILAKDFNALALLCSMYTPVSMEILRPHEVKLSVDKAHELLMALSSNWYNIKKFITERTSSKEDLEQYKKYLENRIEIGKKLLSEDNKGKTEGKK